MTKSISRSESQARAETRARLGEPGGTLAPSIHEPCMCGGTIRLAARDSYDEGIRDAVREHNATERHQAYMTGRKP